MNKTESLLKDCKIRLKISTDYALGKALNISRQRISDYMSGRVKPDEYACFRIAEALGREPAEVIAEINSETGRHQDFFADFISRRAVPGFAAVLALSSSAIYAPACDAGELRHVAHNVYYVKSSIIEYWPLFLCLFLALVAAFPRHHPPKKTT